MDVEGFPSRNVTFRRKIGLRPGEGCCLPGNSTQRHDYRTGGFSLSEGIPRPGGRRSMTPRRASSARPVTRYWIAAGGTPPPFCPTGASSSPEAGTTSSLERPRYLTRERNPSNPPPDLSSTPDSNTPLSASGTDRSSWWGAAGWTKRFAAWRSSIPGRAAFPYPLRDFAGPGGCSRRRS